MQNSYKYDFDKINQHALSAALVILQRWLPDGHIDKSEYIALNPTRNDNKKGSFRINLTTGVWSDFATSDKGKGFISLTCYLFKIDPTESAKKLSSMLGLEVMPC